MSISDHVHVARRFQRSIRIDVDLHDPKALEGFVCPKSSAEVLATMARHVADTGQAAFTWTGPYGSGKSSLVIALSAALNGSAKLRMEAAATIGKNAIKTIWDALPPKTKGWRILPIVSQRATPCEVIGEALVANGYVRKGVVKRWTDDKVVAALLKTATENPKVHGGLVVVLDEMGKFLEGAAQADHDIFLFQSIAEAAVRSKGRLIVIGILHQAFDEYANRLSRDLRDEWAKVQGRYIDLVINTNGDEQLDLLARAIQSNRTAKRPSSLSQLVGDTVRAGRPSASADIAMLLERCWPLHPVVACVLGPISRRRFGQNQRSLFGFLNSAEPFGFQNFLRNASDNELFGPDQLWDYLKVNLESAILASPDGHRWSMAVEAIERCEAVGGLPIHHQILKAIAILDLFRERSGLIAGPDLLAACVSEKVTASKVNEALKQLQSWSLIIFRKHLAAFAIYAGSDFDVDQALTEATAATKEINFRELRSFAGLQPVLAKRHYHMTGAFRWFDVDLVPLSNVIAQVTSRDSVNGAIGRFLLVIPTDNETKPKAVKACQEAVDQAKGDVVVGLSPTSWQVMQLAREFLAITKIAEERPELNGDPIARREVAARLSDLRARLEAELGKMFNTAEWFRRGEAPAHHTYSELNSLASAIADQRYTSAPHLPNELVNRQKPSANAMAALKALLRLMVGREGEERLGMEGFPPERGLFESVLLKSRLYRIVDGAWQFAAPEKKGDPCNTLAAWTAATKLLETNSQRTVSGKELFDLWQRPPYGVKEGLLPVLGVAFALSRRDRIAVYREGIFQARFSDLEIDYLVTDAASIQFRWMDLSDLSRKILSGLAAIIREIDGQNQLIHLEPIDVARGLVGIHDRLQSWVKRTNHLSANALQVRALFKQASDPNKFLFDDIPSVFGHIDSKKTSAGIDQIIERIRDGLRELTNAYSEMLERLQGMMLTELQVPNSSSQSLTDLRSRAENIRQLTGDFRLNAFVSRLSQCTGSMLDMEGIASLATNKPPRDWVDADLDQARVEIADLAQKFIRSEAYARVKGRPDKRMAMAIIVGRNGRPTPVSGDFAITDADSAAVGDLIERVERTLASADGQRRNIILAALAEMSAKYLGQEDLEHRVSRSTQKLGKR